MYYLSRLRTNGQVSRAVVNYRTREQAEEHMAYWAGRAAQELGGRMEMHDGAAVVFRPSGLVHEMYAVEGKGG